MTDSYPDIRAIQKQFVDFHSILLGVMNTLSGISNPVASSAIQDLSKLTTSMQGLQESVSDKLEARQRQLDALVGVGYTINSSLGLKAVLDRVIDIVIDLMQAERGLIMLRNENGELSNDAARGMDQVDLDGDEFLISKTIVQRVVETGEHVLTTNAQEDPRFGNQMSVVEHNLHSILCVPLKIKAKIIGVIFVDSRMRSGLFNADDLGLLSAFANQAAIAINNARLFEELKEAYDETIRGWGLALELRDRETEGHTQRVTDLTVRLAKELGVNGETLDHIRRGALLHDIGKMAIPDSVLLKPGELSLTERKFMELHPEIAKDMLEKITFLRPALDIPYYHHEQWDGSGYPHNLKGDDIPFAARIFAVVDVWDALTSERPYRAPVAPDEVRRIIREKAGSHFDPQVVDVFLSMGDLPVAERASTTQIIQKLT